MSCRLNLQQIEFKSRVQTFLRLYSYISQISNFGEIHWEKTFVFLTYLNKKLPKRDSEKISVSDSIDLDSFRIQKIGESKLELENLSGELEPIYGTSGKGKKEEERELLSEIIERINSLFGGNFLKEDDRLTIERIQNNLGTNKDLILVMKGDNSEEVKYEYFKQQVKNNVIDVYSEKFDLYKVLMNEKVFPQLVSHFFNVMVNQHR